MEFAILLDSGQLIQDPGWRCPSDVMHSYHGFGVQQAYGTLVSRQGPSDQWVPVEHK